MTGLDGPNVGESSLASPVGKLVTSLLSLAGWLVGVNVEVSSLLPFGWTLVGPSTDDVTTSVDGFREFLSSSSSREFLSWLGDDVSIKEDGAGDLLCRRLRS